MSRLSAITSDYKRAVDQVAIVLAGKSDHLVEEYDLLANYYFFAKDATFAGNLLLVALDSPTASKATVRASENM